jgi:hypothetical protein
MILVGGFGFSGVPSTLINAVRDRPELKDFTIVSNNAGMPGVGLGNSLSLSLFLFLGQMLRLYRSIARVPTDQQDDRIFYWREQGL